MPSFAYSGAIVTWTVPSTGPYRIRAVGAQGGDGSNGYSTVGGKGADMAGDFNLTAGQVLKLLVGQKPPSNPSVVCNGGGGGTFVADNSNNNPLVVAGGGNGSGTASGQNARTTNSGTQNGNTGAAGGAGFATNGGTDSWVSNPPKSFTNGGGGAGPGAYTNYGGFGGGGCTHGNHGTQNPGGGGYEGGASTTSGTAAGSYNNGTSQSNNVYTGTGDGFIEITLLNTPPTAPTNVSAPAVQSGTALAVSWTHNDPEGNPQAKRQLRYRPVDV